MDQRDFEEFVKPSGSAGGSPAIISNECETSLVMLRLAETSRHLEQRERSLRFFAKAQNDGEETLRITGEGKNLDSPDGERKSPPL